MSISEFFLDDYLIDSLQGCSRVVNSPTKYGSNPVLGDATWTWDRDINYCTLQMISSTLYLWYVGVTTSAEVYTCRATSTDGQAFTIPNHGLISYGGNTNNNILLAEKGQASSVYFNDSLTPKYYMAGEAVNGQSLFGCYLWTSSDGINWTLAKTIHQSDGTAGDYKEGRQIVRRDDGRFLFYYMGSGTAQRRQMGAFLSDTTDVTSTWTDLGVMIDSQTQDTQDYHFSEMDIGDIYLGVGCNYNKTTELIDKLRLYTSRDRMNWTRLSSDWLGLGTSGQWDDSMMIPSMPLIRFDNDWRAYYTGFGTDHAAALPREARMGYATIGYGRIGGVGTTGRVTTKPITFAGGEALNVNADASGGTLQASLLDSNNVPVPGYSATESNMISSDTYETAITWSGAIPAGDYKIRFDLTGTTLHSFTAA